MTSIPSFPNQTIKQAPLTRIAPQTIHFGNTPEDKAEIKAEKPSKAETIEVKKGDFIRGGLGAGLKRVLHMAFLRPTGWIETIADVATMIFSGFLVPPPFATKHFLEGLIGANTLFMKGERTSFTTNPWAHSKEFFAEDYGNRTVISAIWNGVFKMFGKKPSDFDIAKAKELKTKAD